MGNANSVTLGNIVTPMPTSENDVPVIDAVVSTADPRTFTQSVAYAQKVGNPLLDIEPIPASIEETNLIPEEMSGNSPSDPAMGFISIVLNQADPSGTKYISDMKTQRYNLIKKLGYTGKNIIAVRMSHDGKFSLEKINIRTGCMSTNINLEHFTCNECGGKCSAVQGGNSSIVEHKVIQGGHVVHGNNGKWTKSWGDVEHEVGCGKWMNKSVVFFVKHVSDTFDVKGKEVDCDEADVGLMMYHHDGVPREYNEAGYHIDWRYR